MDSKFNIALDNFCVAAAVKINEHYKKHYPTLEVPHLSYEFGTKTQKYVRIVQEDIGQRSVYCFVQVDNGDVLKAAGWKAPAKHARSNIYADDCGVSGVTTYGAVYL